MPDSLDGKVVIVTGAAGGIGRATSVRLAERGVRVFATDLEGTALAETAAAAGAAEIATATHDVTSADDWQRVVSGCASRFGGVDGLVNNAGIEGAVCPLDQQPDDMFDQVMAVNVKGVFLGTKHVIGELRNRGGGAIVNLASVAGLIGDSNIGPYVASKHAVIGLTKSTAIGYAGERIRANAVCPSPIDTRMMRSLEAGLGGEGAEGVKKMMEERIPLGRYGAPEEVASVIVFLLSDDSSYVTGSTYTVDGGMTFS